MQLFAGWLILSTNSFVDKPYLRNYTRSEVEKLQVFTLWWLVDADLIIILILFRHLVKKIATLTQCMYSGNVKQTSSVA